LRERGAEGYVRAADAAQARAMVPDVPGLRIVPLHPAKMWPGHPDQLTAWRQSLPAKLAEAYELLAVNVLTRSQGGVSAPKLRQQNR